MSEDKTTSHDCFKSRAAAYAWLKEQKAPISQRGFYDACDRGFPAVAADKSLSRFEVSEYLRSLESKQRRAPGGSGTIREDAETRKAVADAAKAEIQVQEMQRQLDHKWIEREAADKEKAAVLILLYNNINYQIQKESAEIALRLGIQVAQREEIEIYFEEAICHAFNEIAKTKLVQMDFEDDDDDLNDDHNSISEPGEVE